MYTTKQNNSNDEGMNRENKHSILCLVKTCEKNYKTKFRAVQRTWARRCDKTLYTTDTPMNDPMFLKSNVLGKDKNYLAKRLFDALIQIHKRQEEGKDRFDWLYITDDDIYVIVENLRHFLSKFNPQKKHYMGFRHPIDFIHGGSGIVMSRATFHILITQGILPSNVCLPFQLPGKLDDIIIGQCLRKLGIQSNATQTVDFANRQRFFKESPICLLRGRPGWCYGDRDEIKWFTYRDVIQSTEKYQFEVLSEETISFHYMRPGDMYLVDFLLYNLARGAEKPRDTYMLSTKWAKQATLSKQNTNIKTITSLKHARKNSLNKLGRLQVHNQKLSKERLNRLRQLRTKRGKEDV